MRIVITGTTSGIGRELALSYARDYAEEEEDLTLGLTGRRTERLEEVARECEELNAHPIFDALDVRDEEGMAAFAERFVDEAGGVDVVVANAGVGDPDDLASGNAGYHAFLFEVNVIGLLNTLLPFIPTMMEQKSGQLVAIASVAGFRALPGTTTYAATKIAVRTLMEGYGWELERHGVTATCINPGFVESELTARNKFDMPFMLETDAAVKKIKKAIRRQKRSYTFPWQMAIVSRLLSWVPGGLITKLAPSRGGKKAKEKAERT